MWFRELALIAAWKIELNLGGTRGKETRRRPQQDPRQEMMNPG